MCAMSAMTTDGCRRMSKVMLHCSTMNMTQSSTDLQGLSSASGSQGAKSAAKFRHIASKSWPRRVLRPHASGAIVGATSTADNVTCERSRANDKNVRATRTADKLTCESAHDSTVHVTNSSWVGTVRDRCRHDPVQLGHE